MPKEYYCRHMETGLCGYSEETILVDGDTTKNMIPSFKCKPVYVLHQDDDLNEMENMAVGYITESFYNELDGWLWAKFIVVKDEGHDVIERGWSVSNAYLPTEWGEGGIYHNLPYDRKMINGDFQHLALVSNPRYEDARIFTPEEFKQYQEEKRNNLKKVHNSKPKEGAKKMPFKLFKNKREEVTEIDTDTHVVLENGTDISIGDMVKVVEERAKENAKKNEEEKEKMNMDSEIKVGEDTMTLKELINRYESSCKNKNEDKDDNPDDKKNEDEEDDKDNSEDKDEDKKSNSADDALEKERIKNAKHYNDLRNAGGKGGATVQSISTASSQCALGQKRYGSRK